MQEPTQFAIEAVALAHVREGAVQGCGLRLTGGEVSAAVSSWFDVSFNLFRSGIGLVQSIVYEMRPSLLQADAQPMRASVESTWIRVSAEGTARRGENLQHKDALVYTMLGDDVLEVFEAVADRRLVTIGIKRWGQPLDTLYSGTPSMTEASRRQAGACLEALAGR